MDKKEIKIPRPSKELPKEEDWRPKMVIQEKVHKFIRKGERYWDKIEKKEF